MHKPETTNRSHSQNRGCIKPGTVHARVWALLDQLLTQPTLQDAVRSSRALTTWPHSSAAQQHLEREINDSGPADPNEVGEDRSTDHNLTRRTA
jgi:hypothetical protein